MRAAPTFQLALRLSAVERGLVAWLSAVACAASATWLWSFVDAAAGTAGHGPWAWAVVGAVAAGVGGWLGWAAANPEPSTLKWHQGRWTWANERDWKEHEVIVEPRIDLGSWVLLVLRWPDGVTRWASVGRRRAGQAWHPLRATLFAPPRRSIEPGAGEGAPR